MPASKSIDACSPNTAKRSATAPENRSVQQGRLVYALNSRLPQGTSTPLLAPTPSPPESAAPELPNACHFAGVLHDFGGGSVARGPDDTGAGQALTVCAHDRKCRRGSPRLASTAATSRPATVVLASTASTPEVAVSLVVLTTTGTFPSPRPPPKKSICIFY